MMVDIRYYCRQSCKKEQIHEIIHFQSKQIIHLDKNRLKATLKSTQNTL